MPPTKRKKRKKAKVATDVRLNKAIPILPPYTLDSNRSHFYGHTIAFVLGQGGIQWLRVKPNLEIEVLSSKTKELVTITPLVACTRDRLFVSRYVMARLAGKPTSGLQWHFDMYDKELHAMLEAWGKANEK